jgi:very-short-patch-repair endonuclease
MTTRKLEHWRASEQIQQRARELRREMTPAERRLWQALRGNVLEGAHFRRQHAIGPYILDFYCAKARLAIELDGGSHLEQEQYDEERTNWLESEKGMRVIRFSNQDVQRDLDSVIEAIREALEQAPT